jgi:hypothetical protein
MTTQSIRQPLTQIRTIQNEYQAICIAWGVSLSLIATLFPNAPPAKPVRLQHTLYP